MTKAFGAFKKIFPFGRESYGRIMDGYQYIRHTRLYVYYLQKIMSQFSKGRKTLVYPENHSDPGADELVKLTTDMLAPELLSK